MRMLLQVLGLIAVPNFILGVRLPGCSSDRLAVDETSNTVVTCDQFDAQDTVGWYLTASPSKPDITLGTCTPQKDCNQGTLHKLTRSSTQSTLTFIQSANIRSIGSYRIQCGVSLETTTSCALVVFNPSVVQNCQVEARSGSWTFDGSCNITKTFSSNNTYECEVFRGKSQSSQATSVKSVDYTPRPHSNARYRMGSCSFSSDFKSLLSGITNRQDFYFKINVYPGPTPRVVGPVTLEKPVTPGFTIRCPDIVAENTTFTCTCSTTNLGQPAGRLVWSRVPGGTIKEGEYGATTLTLPSQNLTRHDQGVKFRCDLKWAAGSYMAEYTGNIGFPPSKTVLKVNSTTPGQMVTVSENNDVSFTCTATGGNPKSTLTLSYATSTITTGRSPLIHSLGKAQCQDSGDYTCTANNGYGDSVTSSARLYVNCLPRTSMEIPAFNFIEKKDEITFRVTAYPVPTLNLLYIGKSDNTTGSPAKLPDSIQMNGSCEAMGGMIHKSTCTITVYNVTSNEAAGFYQVTLTNSQGNTNATFEIKYKAPVLPSQESQLGNAAVIGGVIGAVVVAGIIAVVVVIVLKRRKGHKKENNNSTAASRPRNGQGRNSFHEKEEPGLADADPEAPSRPLSFAPMAVYAQVDKSKKSNPAAAAQEAEANGGQPADVYAVVEKTKKKQASGAGAKPKTVAKAAGKPKKKKKKDESAHVYGNVRGAKAKKTSTPSKEETSSGKMVNPEGLIYTAVEFSQPPKSGKPAPKKPEEEPVVYSAVDFTKSPAP